MSHDKHSFFCTCPECESMWRVPPPDDDNRDSCHSFLCECKECKIQHNLAMLEAMAKLNFVHSRLAPEFARQGPIKPKTKPPEIPIQDRIKNLEEELVAGMWGEVGQ